ncbi:MAG: galactose oxidase [Nitrospira sp.]|nr:MAG: galactose oxidase [Nitrospira sp.]
MVGHRPLWEGFDEWARGGLRTGFVRVERQSETASMTNYSGESSASLVADTIHPRVAGSWLNARPDTIYHAMLPWTLLKQHLNPCFHSISDSLDHQSHILMMHRRAGTAVSLPLLTCFALLLSASFTFAQNPAPGAGMWQTMASAPTKRTEVVGAAVGDKVYVVGGFSEPSLSNLMNLAVSDTVEEYDPSTNRWATKAPLPIGLHHAGAASVGDRLYIIGGFTKSLFSVWQPVASVYMYNPEADSWAERAPMPTKRGALAVVQLGGKLFAIGGYDGTGNSGAVEVYDPATDSWTAKASLPTPRDHLAAAAVGMRIYAIGGRLNRDYGRNLSIVEAYDPVADRWSQVANLPTARSGITAAVVQETIYVFGGEAPEGTFRTTEAYSLGIDRWQTMAPMPTGRHGLASATVNGHVYVLSGGPRPGGSFSNVNEMFVPPSAQGQEMGTDRKWGQATFLRQEMGTGYFSG